MNTTKTPESNPKGGVAPAAPCDLNAHWTAGMAIQAAHEAGFDGSVWVMSAVELAHLLNVASDVAPAAKPDLIRALELGRAHAKWSVDRSTDLIERRMNQRDLDCIDAAIAVASGLPSSSSDQKRPSETGWPYNEKVQCAKRIMEAVDTYHARPDAMNRSALRSVILTELDEYASGVAPHSTASDGGVSNE